MTDPRGMPAPDRSDDAGFVPAPFAYTLAAAVSISLWMRFGSWGHRPVNVVAILAGGLSAALILATLSSAHPEFIGASVASPALLVSMTADHGDGDGLGPGLSLLGFVWLGAFAYFVSMLARPLSRPLRRGHIARSVRDRRAQGALALVAAAALTITVLEWPRPYAEINAVLATIDTPGFRLEGVSRGGRRLQTSNGGPSITRMLSTRLSSQRACGSLRESLASAGVRGLRRVKVTVYGEDVAPCSYAGRIRGGPFGSFSASAGRARQDEATRPVFFVTVACGCGEYATADPSDEPGDR